MGKGRYVFPGTKVGRPIRDLECVWVKVRDAAGIGGAMAPKPTTALAEHRNGASPDA